MEHMDIFNDDAFSLVSLTAAINNIDHVPGRVGELVFAGVGEGVATESVSIEMKDESLTLIQTSARGGPAPQEKESKSTLRSIQIPHIKLEETIGAARVQNVRQFGSPDRLKGVQSVVNGQMAKMTQRHDMTIEYHRLGAVKGKIFDADGTTVLTDLFTFFGITNDNSDVGGSATDAAPKIFDFKLDNYTVDSFDDNLRANCAKVARFMTRNAKTIIPQGSKIWFLCGDNFFDSLLEHPSFKAAFQNTDAAKAALGDSYVWGAVEFGGIVWENYRGTDDNSTVSIGANEARGFFTGVPGLYAEYFAPADFMDTVNTIGLPRYARTAVDPEFQRWVKLHTQQNPLPLCLRPKTLVKATI
jgi:hypothetical protein